VTLKVDIIKLERLINKVGVLPTSLRQLPNAGDADQAKKEFNVIRDDFMSAIWLYPDQRENYHHLKDSRGLGYIDALKLFTEISKDVIRTMKSLDSSTIKTEQPSNASSSNHQATNTSVITSDVKQITSDSDRSDLDREKSRRVWVIHGRNEKLVGEVFAFLRAIGLHPIEWGEARAKTGVSSPYIGEILKAGFNYAQAFVVMLTGDDEAKLRNEYIKTNDPPYEQNLTPQARQNVIFEAGMAFGRDPDRIIFVKQGILRPFSNISGIHILELDNTPETRIEFSSRLKSAGCDVPDLTSRKDWLKAGDFAPNKDHSANPTLSKPDIEVEITQGRWDTRHKTTIPHSEIFVFTAFNSGEETALDSYGILVKDTTGEKEIPEIYPLGPAKYYINKAGFPKEVNNFSYPCKVSKTNPCTVGKYMDGIIARLTEKGYRGRVELIAYFKDVSQNIYKSRPYSIDIDQCGRKMEENKLRDAQG
jgi:predicted nucleotide-binding protein